MVEVACCWLVVSGCVLRSLLAGFDGGCLLVFGRLLIVFVRLTIDHSEAFTVQGI